MKKSIVAHFSLCLAVMFVFLAFPSSFCAQNLSLTDVIVNNSRRDLLAYFNVRNSFDDETRQALLNGVTVRLIFDIRLFQVRDLWPDVLLAALNLEHSIRYDALKEEFLVDLDGKKYRLKELPKAQSLVSEVSGLSVSPLSKLASNRTYELQIKAARKKDPTPSVFSYIISMLSFWDTETDDYSVEFRY
ncbi:MAG: DUF4390 domain-containing protein [Pseudomonadota bacterium]